MTAVAAPTAIDLHATERDAIVRRAQERLIRIDDIRHAGRLHRAGKTQREIAEILHTTQPRVHRMLRAYGVSGGDEASPEEVILRATVAGTDRRKLVRDLSRMAYTFTEYPSYPAEGSKPGTWQQVVVARSAGLLSKGEFASVCAAVQPPGA